MHMQSTARDGAQINPDTTASRSPAFVLVLDSDEFGVAEDKWKPPQNLQISKVRMALLNTSLTACFYAAVTQ